MHTPTHPSHILLPIIRGRRRPRVWFAACASGEEPLTVAMMLAGRDALGKVDLVATDISLRVLAKAQAGVYGDRSLRALPPSARRFIESGCRLVYLSPQDACYSFNHCGFTSGCVTEGNTDPGESCDVFDRSQLVLLNEFCVEPRLASTTPTTVTIERMTYYPEECICTDTGSCAAPNVCRHDAWLADSKCDSTPGGCPGVCAP